MRKRSLFPISMAIAFVWAPLMLSTAGFIGKPGSWTPFWIPAMPIWWILRALPLSSIELIIFLALLMWFTEFYIVLRVCYEVFRRLFKTKVDNIPLEPTENIKSSNDMGLKRSLPPFEGLKDEESPIRPK